MVPGEADTAFNFNVSKEQMSVSLVIEKTGLSTTVIAFVMVSIHPLSLATINVTL